MVKINPELLTDEVKKILLEDAQSFHFQKNELLVELGQVCKHIYYIEKGMLRNFYYDRKGNDITHWFAKDGMILTVPPSFFKKEPSEFRMEALEDTHVKALTHRQLEKAFESSIQLERFMRILVTETMITLGKKIIDMQTKTAEERYNELVKNYPDIFQRAKLKHISSYLGIAQQSLSRIRANF